MMRRPVLASLLAASAVALVALPASAADRQIRAFLGSSFAGGTTFVDLGNGAAKPHLVIGASLVTVGEIFGVDVDVADARNFFKGDDASLVASSHVLTVTGNVVVAAPRRLTGYSLRPYFVGGGGLMRARRDDVFDALPVASVLPAFDVGGGVLGFVTNRVGVCWEARRFQSFSRKSQNVGLTLIGAERVHFWRASMAIAVRY